MPPEELLNSISKEYPQVKNDGIGLKRLYGNAVKHTERLKAGFDAIFYHYKGRIGLAEWAHKIDTDLVPKSNFIQMGLTEIGLNGTEEL